VFDIDSLDDLHPLLVSEDLLEGIQHRAIARQRPRLVRRVHLHMLQKSLGSFADWHECGGVACLRGDHIFAHHHLSEQLVHLAALRFEGLRGSRAGGLAPPLGAFPPLEEIRLAERGDSNPRYRFRPVRRFSNPSEMVLGSPSLSLQIPSCHSEDEVYAPIACQSVPCNLMAFQ